MFFSDVRVLTRRWYAVLIGLLLTGGLCFGAASIAHPTYEIKASLLLIPPKTAVGEGGNPYLVLGGLDTVAEVVARAMTDGEVHRSLVAAGANKDYLVATDPTTAGPVVLVTTEGRTAAEADTSLRLVTQRVPVALSQLQHSANVPSGSRITMTQISRDEIPNKIRKSQLRIVFVGLAVGLGLTLVGTSLLDALLRRRGDRQLNEEDPVAPPATDRLIVSGGAAASSRSPRHPTSTSISRLDEHDRFILNGPDSRPSTPGNRGAAKRSDRGAAG